MISFSAYQGEVFLRTEELYRTQGFSNTPLFEDTYVLSKRTAEYISANVSVNGNSVNTDATDVYNAILGISVTTSPTNTTTNGNTTTGGNTTTTGGTNPIQSDSLLSLSPRATSEFAAFNLTSTSTIVVDYIKPLGVGTQLNVVSATSSPTNDGFFKIINAFPESQYNDDVVEIDSNGVVVRIILATSTSSGGSGGTGGGLIDPV